MSCGLSSRESSNFGKLGPLRLCQTAHEYGSRIDFQSLVGLNFELIQLINSLIKLMLTITGKSQAEQLETGSREPSGQGPRDEEADHHAARVQRQRGVEPDQGGQAES